MLDEPWFKDLERKKQYALNANENSKLIAIFGSSTPTRDSDAYRDAFNIGKPLAESGCVILNGGYTGIMEASAAGAREVGGYAIGITCHEMKPKIGNQFLTHEWDVRRWDQRLLGLVHIADGYVILPGSSGTLVELSIVLENQLSARDHKKPIICYTNYWMPVIDRINRASDLVKICSDVEVISKDF